MGGWLAVSRVLLVPLLPLPRPTGQDLASWPPPSLSLATCMGASLGKNAPPHTPHPTTYSPLPAWVSLGVCAMCGAVPCHAFLQHMPHVAQPYPYLRNGGLPWPEHDVRRRARQALLEGRNANTHVREERQHCGRKIVLALVLRSRRCPECTWTGLMSYANGEYYDVLS